MKKYLKYILTLIILLPTLSFTHPASDIKIKYDIENSKVEIEVLHSVRDPNDHYIYEVDILLNNKNIIKQFASAQISNKEQRLVYIIPGLKYSDKIEIITECNKGGKIKKLFVIEKNGKKSKEE